MPFMQIYNSLGNKPEEFKPLKKGKVSIYVCGITPYDTTHLGHAFTYISFDALIRFLKFKGFEISYTQNVTDINDRDHDILDRAKEQHVFWEDLADFWTRKFIKDMDTLNWIHPNHYLKASKHINFMIDLIQKLLDKGLAYHVNGSVYLEIKKDTDYGKLSNFSREKMLKVSADFEEDLKNPDKKDPLDITLWKVSSPDQPKHIPAFDSPFGKGRPGWHIECSAMSMEYLDKQIDIHGGGSDLIFPHHEAEIAQSEGATGKVPFIRYWLHTGTVFYQGEKMSKSKGNLVMVSDLLKKYSPNAIRWILLSHHWNKPWEFKEKDLDSAQKNIETIEKSLSSKNLTTAMLDNNLDTPAALDYLLQEKSQKLYHILGFK
jgi:L-cysteine:1D-myo-inositol 2-amino-2-deoxy-alpha-D-glucopyranoside ligase